MSDSYLRNLLPGVLGELQRQNRAKIWREDPVVWAEEYLGLKGRIWAKMREMMYSVRDNYGTAVAAGHGVSKSFTSGLITCWWIATHPLGETETFVATTAPSKAQVDAIWANIRTFHMLSKKRYEEGLVEAPLPGYITSGAEVRWKLDTGETIAQGRKPPDSKSDIAFQGRHATYLLAIVDEGTGVNQDLLDGMDHIATGQHNRQLILCNPTDPGCALAKSWESEPGAADGRPGWNYIYVSMFDSPLVTKEEGIDLHALEGMSGPSTIEAAREKYGEDSAQYQARVLGRWAWDESNNLFPEEAIARAMRCHVLPDGSNPIIQFGVDVARYGSDSSAVYEAQVGEIWETDPETDKPTKPTGRQGLYVRRVADWRGAPVTSTDPENMGTAERVHAKAMANGAHFVNVDAGAMGAGVIDALLDKDGTYQVVEVWGNSTQGVDTRAHLNLRAQQFDILKRRMLAGEIDLDASDTQMLDELRGLRYEWVRGSIMKIESKDEMRRRGVKSPDFADAVWYACLDLSSEEGAKPGDVVTADITDFITEDHFWHGSRGIAAAGW